MICKQCNRVFEAKRVDALFCSDSCRKAYKRNKPDIIPDKIKSDTIPDVRDKPANYGADNCECRHCRAVRSNGLKVLLYHGPYKPASQLSKAELNRVPLPGDVDYKGCSEKISHGALLDAEVVDCSRAGRIARSLNSLI